MRYSISSLASQTGVFPVAVVGAGPAGVAAVGQLLDSGLANTLAWIDPKFNGGRLEFYREVPSNTRASLFTAYGESCKSFGGRGNPATADIQQLPQDKGCHLGHAHDLVNGLTRGLRALPDVTSICAQVLRLQQVDHRLWQLSVSKSAEDNAAGTEEKQQTVLAKNVFLATGSSPRVAADIGAPHQQYAAALGIPGPEELPLDTALNPAALQQLITPQDEVAVVGSSHSAVLSLKNLSELPFSSRPRRIVNFYRSPLQYAEYRDDEHGQWILRDNTGLKGLVADWAKLHLESPEAKWRLPGLERVSMFPQPDKAFGRALPGCTKIVYAVGYKRNALPDIVLSGEDLPVSGVSHDVHTGQLTQQTTGAVLPGLFGCGIAFPELWTDPFGNKELAVGMFKFMRFMKKVVPAAMSAES